MAHADMVCEATRDCPYDPNRDPIPVALWSENGVDYLVAEGFKSTLGADNGIGLAMIIELISNGDLRHPPIDALITVEEEIGLNGAKVIEPSFVEASTGINLDSEQEGTQTVATAGMCYSVITASPPAHRLRTEDRALSVVVSGLRGGHSGLEIHCRASAITVLCNALQAALTSFDFLIATFSGGTAGNTIPTTASADIVLVSALANDCAAMLNRVGRDALAELGERAATIEVSSSTPTSGATGIDANYVIRLISSIPTGALSFNEELPGRPVQQSNNVWSVRTAHSTLRIECSSRAMSDSGLDGILEMLQVAAARNNASLETMTDSRFPPWEPCPDSPIQRAVAESYCRLSGKPMQSLAVHGGLELSVIQAKFGELNRSFDATSIGPTILGAHTVRERVDIESTGRVFQLVCDVLAEWS